MKICLFAPENSHGEARNLNRKYPPRTLILEEWIVLSCLMLCTTMPNPQTFNGLKKWEDLLWITMGGPMKIGLFAPENSHGEARILNVKCPPRTLTREDSYLFYHV